MESGWSRGRAGVESGAVRWSRYGVGVKSVWSRGGVRVESGWSQVDS